MTSFLQKAPRYSNPELMAADFLKAYWKEEQIEFPINPFQMLVDMGLIFSMRPFHKLEGVYMPASGDDDIPIVGINLDRPIARQRFTAAHELCHHLHDSGRQIACAFNSRSNTERFAESFAAAILMPLDELRAQVNQRLVNGFVTFDSILEIAHYFGVSFESCAYRIAYKLGAVEGDTTPTTLQRRFRAYRPQKKREEYGYSDLTLYESLIDAYSKTLAFSPNNRARYIFQNHYIYNDSRMEGVMTDLDAASEIVTDLRTHQQLSPFCSEEYEAYLSIAGHYLMYQEILKNPVKETCTVYDTIDLNRKLFSCYPHPEFGGNFRQDDTLVLGAKFETIPFRDIPMAMYSADQELQEFFPKRDQMTTSKYFEAAVKLHHHLTVIHPYADGNGRTLRAFLNMMLVRAQITPMYIKVEEKREYLEALEHTDLTGDYTKLYIFMFQVLLRRNAELCS